MIVAPSKRFALMVSHDHKITIHRLAGDLLDRTGKIPGMATMERLEITSLFILDSVGNEPVGIIHLHDLLKAGIV